MEFPGGLAVKDSVLSLLWHEFNPWPRELPHAVGVTKKKKRETDFKKFPKVGVLVVVQWVKNLTSIHEDVCSILALLNGLRIQCCYKLWYR